MLVLRRSFSPRLLVVLAGTSGSSLVVCEQKKTQRWFIFRASSRTGSCGRRRSHMEHCHVSAVVFGVGGGQIYMNKILNSIKILDWGHLYVWFWELFMYPHGKAAGLVSSSSVLCLVLDVGFLRCWVAAVTVSGRGDALFLLSRTWQFESFDFFFFILIKEVAESGIPAAHFYYTWTLRCRHRRRRGASCYVYSLWTPAGILLPQVLELMFQFQQF